MVHATWNMVNNLPPPFVVVVVAPRLRRAKVCVNVLVGEVGGLSGLLRTWETIRCIEKMKKKLVFEQIGKNREKKKKKKKKVP